MTETLLGYRLILFDSELREEKRFDLLPTEVMPSETALTRAVPLPHGEVHLHKDGRGIGSMLISGSFGREERPVAGQLTSGTELFFKFKKEFWARYLELSRHPDPSVANKVKVELYCWEEGEHWWVEPIRFDTPRSSDNKTYFVYDLEFLLLRPVVDDVQRNALLRSENRRQAANRYLSALKTVNAKVRGAGAFIRGLRDTASETLNRFVFSQIGELQQSLEAFVSGVSAVVHLPARSLLDMAGHMAQFLEDTNTLATAELTEWANDLRRMRKLLLRIANTPELFESSVSEAVGQIENSAQELGSALSSVTSGLEYKGSRPIAVKRGDTLPKIAARELGDATRWESIALLNNLRYPYFSESGEPGTLKPGETLWVPTQSEQGSNSPTQTSSLSPEDRLYGRDLLVRQEGGTFSVVFENGDLVTVSGRNNLSQAITLATTIEEGQLLEDGSYGLRRPRGKLTQADLEELKNSIERVASRDDRVAKAEAKVEATGNKTEVSIKLYPVGDGRSPLNNLVEIPR